MRLFVGFTPSPEAVDHLAEAVDRIGDPRRTPSTAPALRWMPCQRWHVTLAFLGEVNPDRISRIEDALDDIAVSHEPLGGLHLTGAGTFRGVLWCGLEPAARHSPADRLARAVQRAMRATGVPVESKPWQAHLTLARWRAQARDEREVRRIQAALAGALSALDGYAGPAFDVNSLTLVQSITGPRPEYVTVSEFSLRGPGSSG